VLSLVFECTGRVYRVHLRVEFIGHVLYGFMIVNRVLWVELVGQFYKST